jgi:hypothetical protein
MELVIPKLTEEAPEKFLTVQSISVKACMSNNEVKKKGSSKGRPYCPAYNSGNGNMSADNPT